MRPDTLPSGLLGAGGQGGVQRGALQSRRCGALQSRRSCHWDCCAAEQTLLSGQCDFTPLGNSTKLAARTRSHVTWYCSCRAVRYADCLRAVLRRVVQ